MLGILNKNVSRLFPDCAFILIRMHQTLAKPMHFNHDPNKHATYSMSSFWCKLVCIISKFYSKNKCVIYSSKCFPTTSQKCITEISSQLTTLCILLRRFYWYAGFFQIHTIHVNKTSLPSETVYRPALINYVLFNTCIWWKSLHILKVKWQTHLSC